MVVFSYLWIVVVAVVWIIWTANSIRDMVDCFKNWRFRYAFHYFESYTCIWVIVHVGALTLTSFVCFLHAVGA